MGFISLGLLWIHSLVRPQFLGLLGRLDQTGQSLFLLPQAVDIFAEHCVTPLQKDLLFGWLEAGGAEK